MSQQTELALFDEKPTVEALVSKPETQWFDRKSFRIEAANLCDRMIGFANADGGRIAIGIHNGVVEGINSNARHESELQQAAMDFAEPLIRHSLAYVDCVNREGQPDRIMLLDIEASEQKHRNRKGECFLRVGDENRRLNRDEERELGFDKGEANYDKTIVEDLARDDLDELTIRAYAEKFGTTDAANLLRCRGIYLDGPYRQGVTQAGWLLFGKIPPIWSYIRYLRYDGATEETGTRSNLIKDVRMEGTIPSLIEQSKALLADELTVIRLTPNGRFGSVPALPEFAWLEAVVNAVTHRSYSLTGDGIRIKQFSDRLEVDSPGRLPGLVRVQNIRNARFARNPHIARVLAEMTAYVRESNEGVKRMFREMTQSGLREPVYQSTGAGVRVILYKEANVTNAPQNEVILNCILWLRKRLGEERLERLLTTLRERKQMPTRDVANLIGVTSLTARNYMLRMQTAELAVEKQRNKFDPYAYWEITDALFWTSSEASLKGT